MSKYLWVLALVTGLTACAPKKPAQPPAPPPPPPVPIDTKAAWTLRLEHQRVLRDGGVDGPATMPVGPRALTEAISADLEGLAVDPDPALRRRALLAIGRVGGAEGLRALVPALTDPDENARATAAFALGLLASKDAIDPLRAALQDPSLAVRGRAIEALGLIGDPSAAPAVADAAGCRSTIAAIEADDEGWPKTPEVEVCRLALFALVRLRDYDALARAALDEQGQPVSRWWPVAYALQRINDARAVPALLTLSSSTGIYTPAFALRGLAAAKDRRVVPPAVAAATRPDGDIRLRAAAVRALGQVGGADVAQPLGKIISDPATPPNLALEAVNALAAAGGPQAYGVMLDLLTDPWPAIRAAAITGAAQLDPEGFLLVISTFDWDPDWSVRAALAGVLGSLPVDRATPALQELAADDDVRVRGPALESLAKIEVPDLTKRLFDALDAPDFVVRATAARLMGERKPQGGAPRLAAAYVRAAEGDAAHAARAAALEALAKYGGEEALTTLRKALADRDWPVRIRAAELLRELGQPDAAPERPAPVRQSLELFESPRLLRPDYSPHAFIETRMGNIEIELNVVDSPLTAWTFVELARAGFFNGIRIHRIVPNFVVQAGDPRGDGEGGPGYTIRDELSPLPFLRGTVGMALDGRDTGGSQFFITVSPQPHLDGRYTVFGRVVNGMDLLDRLSLWDVIERVRIWDGKTMSSTPSR